MNISDIKYVLDDLGMFFNANATHHMITGSAKLKRLEHSRTLLPNIKTKWPPSSPDLNPPDYSVLATLEEVVCKTTKSSAVHLKASIKTAWDIMATNHELTLGHHLGPM